MKPATPLEVPVDWQLGPIAITRTVTVTWGLIAALLLGAWLLRRRLSVERPSTAQLAAEALIAYTEQQIREVIGDEPEPYLPLVLTLFVFILACNLLGALPTELGISPPTADLATTSALALIVFGAVPGFGVWRRGLLPYLSGYLQPYVVMLPLNVIGELSRTLALAVRLFGNMMSGGVLLGIVASLGAVVLAGLPVVVLGVPLAILTLITGVVQAYIFAILAMVFIGAGVQGGRRDASPEPRPEED